MRDLPKPGEQLGRFEIVRKLGRGGMGTVFLATDTFLNIDVALKFLNPWVAKSAMFDRFKREVLLARQISHPGVCRMFDIHEEDGLFFISMEYIDGSTLLSLIQYSGQLPVKRATQLVISICDAMQAAHALKIMHRDLKPGNIIVRGDTQVSILDFGISKTSNMASITATGIQMGTIGYVAPEVLRGDASSNLGDIYSAGVILYECATGRAAFAGTDVVALMKDIDTGNLVPPSVYNRKMPKKLEEAIEKAMAPEISERFQTMAEFKQALVTLLPELPDDGPDMSRRTPSGNFEIDIEESVSQVFTSSIYSEVLEERRQDSTILFARMPHLTSYFEKRGEAAGLRKVRQYSLVTLPLIEEHAGTVLRTAGDSIMASFDNADRGLKAAIDLQYALVAHNSEVAVEEDRIRIGIGLHSGDAIFENSASLGGTANAAALVCGIAEDGEIVLTAETRGMLGLYKHLTQPHSEGPVANNGEELEVFLVDWRQGADETAGIEVQRTMLMRSASQEQESSRRSPASAASPASIASAISIASAAKVAEAVTSPSVARAPIAPTEPAQPIIRPAMQPGMPSAPAPAADPESMKPITLDDVVFETVTETEPSVPAIYAQRRGQRSLFVWAAVFGILVGVALAAWTLYGAWRGSRGDAEPTEPPGVEAPGDEPGDDPTISPRDPVKPAGGDKPVESPVTKSADESPGDIAPDDEEPGAGADGGDETGAVDSGATAPKPPPPLDTSGNPKAGDPQASVSVAKVDRLKRSVLASLREKGLISGDAPGADRELARMSTLRARKRYSDALNAGRRARAEVGKVSVNKSFVRSKINRFNKLFDKIDDPEAAKRVENLVPKILEAVESGQYEKANRLLNRAFSRLGVKSR